MESMRKDKAATEKALQDAVEKGQTELAAQKEFYTTALNEAREAAALAEARVDYEARADLDRRLKEASEREATLVQNIDELRQALTRTEQQVQFLSYSIIYVIIVLLACGSYFLSSAYNRVFLGILIFHLIMRKPLFFKTRRKNAPHVVTICKATR